MKERLNIKMQKRIWIYDVNMISLDYEYKKKCFENKFKLQIALELTKHIHICSTDLF